MSWAHGESSVWRVRGAGEDAVLKAHWQQRKFKQELAAYRDWLPALQGSLPYGVKVPELLAHRSEHPRALLLSFSEGSVMLGSELSVSEELVLHERAGAFLRALHALEVDDRDPVPLVDAYGMRLAAWSARARGLLPGAVVTAVERKLGEAQEYLVAEPRSPLHNDYSPRNWLVSMGGTLTVFDFEHARLGARLADFLPLWARWWHESPGLEGAFFAGYGAPLSREERVALEGLGALWGLSTAVWAREHGDSEFELLGRRVLERLGLSST